MADPATLNEGEQHLVERISMTALALTKACEIAKRFKTILRDKNVDALEKWSNDAIGSDMASTWLLSQTSSDRTSMLCGTPCCCLGAGQVEGHIHRLKHLKRQMYGRA